MNNITFDKNALIYNFFFFYKHMVAHLHQMKRKRRPLHSFGQPLHSLRKIKQFDKSEKEL